MLCQAVLAQAMLAWAMLFQAMSADVFCLIVAVFNIRNLEFQMIEPLL